MELFELDGEQVIAVNSEYVKPRSTCPPTGEGMPKDADAVVVDSPFNRRLHHDTQMTKDDPTVGSDVVKTNDDPEGLSPMGTMKHRLGQD